MENLKVIDENYENYLAKIKTIDLFKRAETLGIKKQDQLYVFDFFDRQIAFDGHDFVDIKGNEVTVAVKIVLCNYLMKCPSKIHITSNKLVTFREFSNAGPLYSMFSENTGKIISTTFSGQINKLKSRCQSLGGTFPEPASYDLSANFKALNRISVFLNFNDADDFMPANAMFLFHDNAEAYLNLESLTIICTYLTGLLIHNR
jgi:hypothetical protein